MEDKKLGIDGEQFKLTIAREMYGDILSTKLQVLTEPEPCTVEHKSRWQIVNWWRKLTGTYYEEGYKYKVKVVKGGEE